MADLSCVYTLATPGGTIRFNDGDLKTLTDLYWIANIEGLDGAGLRINEDDAPQTHGSLVHASKKRGRNPVFEGSILIQSKPWGSNCTEELNAMEENLRLAWESMDEADGTLSWTPAGLSARTLTVRAWQPELTFEPENDYMTRRFNFGLKSAAADWS